MHRTRPAIISAAPPPARPAIRMIAAIASRPPTRCPPVRTPHSTYRAPQETAPPDTPPPSYLDGVAPIPDRLADLFAAADEMPPLPAERTALAEAIDAAAFRVREARADLERSQALRGRRALGP